MSQNQPDGFALCPLHRNLETLRRAVQTQGDPVAEVPSTLSVHVVPLMCGVCINLMLLEEFGSSLF
jgi:hypothetical protein